MSVMQGVLDKTMAAASPALKISLSHPHGNANSYHAARAFAEQGWLQRFQAGILKDSMTARLLPWLPADIKQRALNRDYAGIDETRKQAHLLWEALSRLGSRLKPGGLTRQVNWYDVLFSGHDYQVAKSLPPDLRAIYAYEDGARRTFRAARRKGVTTLYELPLGYYRGVAEEINRARKERPSLQPQAYVEPPWKQARKAEELRLADAVIVPCQWALDSLRFSDADDQRPVIKVPYGTPVDEVAARSAAPDGPFTVLFAGHIGLRKGVPHLLEAWEKLQLKNARLWLAGSLNLPKEYLRRHAASFDYLGAIPRVELLERMRQADLLVFPSLAEGFGLVIGEAMACGVPVLTTVNTGGPELIEDGRQGWCVAAHAVEPLAERLEWAWQHREALAGMGQEARRRAEQWSWADYRRELIARLSPLLA
jgi:alpha-maltose-1-phosphate synthase